MAPSFAVLVIAGLIADWLFTKFKLPGLVGMLAVGALLGPAALDWIHPSILSAAADLKSVALLVILLRAGFELSRESIKKLGRRALSLAALPALFELAAATLVGPTLLGLSYLESAILGCILGAVSPAIVVPMMLRLKQERRGAINEIPATVLTSVSFNNAGIIILYSVLIGVYSGAGSPALSAVWRIASIPAGILAGISAGLLLGVVLYWVFERFNPRATKRVIALIGLAVLLVQAGNLLGARGIPFASLLAVMAIGFVLLEKRKSMASELSLKLAKIWVFAEIVQFTLTGAQIDFQASAGVGFRGLALLGIALAARSAGTWLCTLGHGYSAKEKAFILISNIPKATVQAAFGAAPLALMLSLGMPSAPGLTILAVSILSIIVTAPLGAWAISWAGKKLLEPSGPAGS